MGLRGGKRHQIGKEVSRLRTKAESTSDSPLLTAHCSLLTIRILYLGTFFALLNPLRYGFHLIESDRSFCCVLLQLFV